jgi:hypothetical protein
MTWQEALWAELDAMDDLTQIRMSATWIEELTHSISPALAARRRLKIHAKLQEDGMDATTLAEMVGSRRAAIKRLDEEYRANQREQGRRVA